VRLMSEVKIAVQLDRYSDISLTTLS
jgi:hypothetical protein